VPLALILLYYALILFAAFFPFRRPFVNRSLCAAMLLALLVSLGVMKWQRTHRDHLSITCLDVGHGQAILAQLPGTMNVLFDAGSLYGGDVGTRIIVPFLDHEGISRLHAVIVSHGDIDHINGLPEVVSRRTVDRVYFDETSLTQSRDVETVRVLMDHLRKKRVHSERMPESLDAGSAQIHVLWPTGDPAVWESFSDNDKSLVCLIEYAGRRVLLCSDIEKPAQQEILRHYPTMKADVMVVPHHGSARTLDKEFLAAFDADVLLCSCGQRDHQRGRTITSVECGELWTTARDGAVKVCIRRSGVVERQSRKQR
jgi:competence protein ComEC